jgi:hypothetical protein
MRSSRSLVLGGDEAHLLPRAVGLQVFEVMPHTLHLVLSQIQPTDSSNARLTIWRSLEVDIVALQGSRQRYCTVSATCG